MNSPPLNRRSTVACKESYREVCQGECSPVLAVRPNFLLNSNPAVPPPAGAVLSSMVANWWMLRVPT